MRLRKKAICPNCNVEMTVYSNGNLHCDVNCNYQIQAFGPDELLFTYNWDAEKHKWTRRAVFYSSDTVAGCLVNVPYPNMLIKWSLLRGLNVISFNYNEKFRLSSPTWTAISTGFFDTFDIESECSLFIQEFIAGLVEPDDWNDGPNFYKE